MQPDDYQVKVHKVAVMIMIIMLIMITKVQVSNQITIKNMYSRVNIQSDTEAKFTLYITMDM